MSVHTGSLVERLKARSTKAGVIGLGYVGLPLAIEFAKAGLTVVGVDLDTRKVEALSKGESYIGDVAAKDVAAMVEAGRFRATTDFSALSDVDTINICVPTPLRKTKDPDLSYIVASVEEIAKVLQGRSAHHPRVDHLSRHHRRGRAARCSRPGGPRAGVDFFLGFSPERVDPGNPSSTPATSPRSSAASTRRRSEAGRGALRRGRERTSSRSPAPAWRRWSSCSRTPSARVNIGLVNELALMSPRLGIDVWEVIDAAKTKPFGFMPFYPGPGLGGHCIPIDPFYLSWKARQFGFETPLHRARRPHQRRHAALRRRPRQRGAQLGRQADQGLEGAPVRHGLQVRRRPTIASRRRSTSPICSSGAAPSSPTPITSCRRCRPSTATSRAPRCPSPRRWPTASTSRVITTNHKTFDSRRSGGEVAADPRHAQRAEGTPRRAYLPAVSPPDHEETRADHRHHRPGRLLPGRVPARQGLRRRRHGPPLQRAQPVGASSTCSIASSSGRPTCSTSCR